MSSAPFSSLRSAIAYAYAVHRGPGRAQLSEGPKGYRSPLDGVAVFAAMHDCGIDPWGPAGHALYEWATKKGPHPGRQARKLQAQLSDHGLVNNAVETFSRRDLVNVTWNDPETGTVVSMKGNAREDDE